MCSDGIHARRSTNWNGSDDAGSKPAQMASVTANVASETPRVRSRIVESFDPSRLATNISATAPMTGSRMASESSGNPVIGALSPQIEGEDRDRAQERPGRVGLDRAGLEQPHQRAHAADNLPRAVDGAVDDADVDAAP